MKRSDDVQSKNSLIAPVPQVQMRASGVWKIMGVIIVAMFLILMVLLNAQGSSAVFESPDLLAILNTIFLCAIPLIVSILAARSYQASGVFAFLLIGCGLVFLGVSSLYAGLVMPIINRPNFSVTLHNLGSLYAGICQFVSAHLFLQELSGISKTRVSVQRYWILYAGILALVSITGVLALRGNLPVFFDPITGPSPLRQLVLGGAICLFAVAGLAYVEIYLTAKTEFAYWYGLALLLITIGLICVLLQREVGSVLGWTGRGAQYIGCVYLIFAFIGGRRELPVVDSSSTSMRGWSLWPYLEQRVGERTNALVKTNEAMQIEIAERKRGDQALRESEEKWYSLVKASPDFIALHDPEGNYLFLNHYAEGFTEKEVLGASVYDYLIPESVEIFRNHLERALTTWTDQHFEMTAYGYNGDARIYEEILVPLRGKNQEINILSVARDITERKRVEEALRYLQEETAHINRLLLALSQASQTVQSARSTEEVYSAIEHQVTQLGYYTAGYEVSEDGRDLRIVYFNYRNDLLRKAEKYSGIPLHDFHFRPRADSIYNRIISKGESIFVQDTLQAVVDALPKNMQALARPMTDLFKLKQSIFAPLRVDTETIGILAITGSDLTELDRPAVTAFARTAAIALQNARLYEKAQKEITERKRVEAELAQSRQQLRALTAYWQAAIEAERANISREIHDEFGQSMTALKMDLTWLTNRLPEGDEKVERIRGMNTLIDESIALMRRIATELRPNLLDDLGLNAALEWQAREFSRRNVIPCKLSLPENDPGLDPALNTCLFRVFQEALTNVSRHAQATRVDASLRQEGQTVILSVQDNGRGITEGEIRDASSLGLLGLRERAIQWGGETTIQGVPGKGTTVTISIPIPPSPKTGDGQ